MLTNDYPPVNDSGLVMYKKHAMLRKYCQLFTQQKRNLPHENNVIIYTYREVDVMINFNQQTCLQDFLENLEDMFVCTTYIVML